MKNGKTDIFVLEISYVIVDQFLNSPNMKPYTSILGKNKVPTVQYSGVKGPNPASHPLPLS